MKPFSFSQEIPEYNNIQEILVILITSSQPDKSLLFNAKEKFATCN